MGISTKVVFPGVVQYLYYQIIGDKGESSKGLPTVWGIVSSLSMISTKGSGLSTFCFSSSKFLSLNVEQLGP